MAFNKFEKMFDKFQKRKNFDKWSIPNKKGRQKCYMPNKCHHGWISVELIFQTYCTPPMLQISDFGRSDQQCHHIPNNCILIPRKYRPED